MPAPLASIASKYYLPTMATLTIRNLPDEVHDALRRRAAEHRRSMEAEARDVLAKAVEARPRRDPKDIIESFRAMAPPPRPGEPAGWSGVDEFLAEKRLEAAWEGGRVTGDERANWLDRLARFEIWPDELEAFVASRTPSS